MTRVRISTALVQTITFFEQVTRSRVHGCVEVDDLLFFIVEPGEMGRALGRGGENVRKLSDRLGKRVRIGEFAPELSAFVAGLLHPVQNAQVEMKEDGLVIIHAPNTQSRGIIIGRGGSNLRILETVVKRYFPTVTEIKVPAVE